MELQFLQHGPNAAILGLDRPNCPCCDADLCHEGNIKHFEGNGRSTSMEGRWQVPAYVLLLIQPCNDIFPLFSLLSFIITHLQRRKATPNQEDVLENKVDEFERLLKVCIHRTASFLSFQFMRTRIYPASLCTAWNMTSWENVRGTSDDLIMPEPLLYWTSTMFCSSRRTNILINSNCLRGEWRPTNIFDVWVILS